MNQELPKPLREALARQTPGDGHPSPDALTAFVEHSLPIRESQRITHHLAQCVDCREVVFLASSAVEEPVGEEQEWMPAAAVPRISPAMLAKTEARATPVGASPRRGWTLWWAWVPAIAVVVLVGAVLVRRSEFPHAAPQSSLTMASKEPMTVAPNSQQAAAAPPAPESEAKLAVQKPPAKSARTQTNPAQASDVLPSALVASKTSEHYPSAPAVTATPKPLSSPAPEATFGVYKSAPAAIPRQNAFVESEAQECLRPGSEVATCCRKAEDGAVPAIAGRRSWHITPDGHLEHLTAADTWTRVLADQPATFRVVSAIGENVWVGGSGGVLFHSSDNGQNWNKEPLSSSGSVETGTLVSIRFSDALHGVITTERGSRWDTLDGGATWTKE